MRKVISIAGTGRSGTNILTRVFGQHSQIATLPFEYRFIIDPRGVIDFFESYTSSWSPYKADFQIKELQSFLLSLAELTPEKQAETKRIKAIDPGGLALTPPPYSGWELNKWIVGYSDFVEELISELKSFSYSAKWPGAEANQVDYQMDFGPRLSKGELAGILSSFLAKCFNAICEQQGKAHYLEDNTHNILFAANLKAIIPTLKLVHVVRDPRDVISSLTQQKWAPNELQQAILWYKEVMQQWESQKAQLNAEDYLEVRFEDILANPEEEVQRICAFGEVEFEASMMSVAFDQPNKGRYKESFSPKEIERLNSELKTVLERYGYPESA